MDAGIATAVNIVMNAPKVLITIKPVERGANFAPKVLITMRLAGFLVICVKKELMQTKRV